jgi:hypothetical protein
MKVQVCTRKGHKRNRALSLQSIFDGRAESSKHRASERHFIHRHSARAGVNTAYTQVYSCTAVLAGEWTPIAPKYYNCSSTPGRGSGVLQL